MNRPEQVFPGGVRLTIDTGDTDRSENNSPFSVDFTTPTEHKFPPSSPSHFPPNIPNTSKALNESRKLLAHLLGQLQNRTLPPPVFDAFKEIGGLPSDTRLADVVKSVRAAVRLNGGKTDARIQSSLSQREDSDEEDDPEQGFTTDATFSLMSQLKDVLLISKAQNWQIFHDSPPSGGIEDRRDSARSPFRLRRSSLQPGSNKRSRSGSPNPGGQVRAPALLSQCISVLASVVLEDCRYKISSPRPSRPPNALQAVVLDVSQFLIHSQHHDSKVISQIAFALIPAFSTFHIEMQPRLLAFFEEGVIRGVLQGLSLAQGASPIEPLLSNKEGLTVEATEKPAISIQIEGPEDDNSEPTSSIASRWTPWSSSLRAEDSAAVQSTRAPLRPLPVYYLASIIPPLLVAMLESIDLNSPSPSTLHRFCRLVDLIATSKADAYLDVLEVVAYHTVKARRSALCLLATFWPNAIGHVTISKPLPVFSTELSLQQRTAGTVATSRRRPDHPYAHQFVPWRFMSSSKPTAFEDMLQHACRSCSNAIQGFGLLCPFCMCAVHFDCYDYPDGSFLSQYALASDPNTQKVAVHRFCHLLSPRRDYEPHMIQKERHAFRAVNIFTLSLCFICRRPLWGCIMQGLKCSSCEQFVHTTCLSRASSADLPRCRSTKIDSSHMTISSDLLRLSFLDHYRDIITVKDLETRSYEEISVITAVLWTQLQLLNNGIALGSVVIQDSEPTRASSKRELKKWELHYVLEHCETYIASGRLPISSAMDEYLQESHCTKTEHSLWFDWSNLVYIATIVKSSFEESQPVSMAHDLLNVHSIQGALEDAEDTPRRHYELVPISHMRDALGFELHLHSDLTAGHLLAHLHHLGFFHRQDLGPTLYEGKFTNEDIRYAFPIPLGLDLSTDVETLFAAVEGCLTDLDLSVNEQGFLLLTRRIWPNGMASEYALRRLTKNVISWIFAEDTNLATILRDYLAQNRQLPGVRGGVDSAAWPSSSTSRPGPNSAVSNGGDYIASRRALLNQYGSRWLLAFHDQNSDVYGQVLYGICSELAEDAFIEEELFTGRRNIEAIKKRKITYVNSILRSIIKLCQTSVIFSVFDDLFLMWLETISSMDLYREPMPALLRLFNRENIESGSRFSSTVDVSSGPVDTAGTAVADSWRMLLRVASSGVDIPVATYKMFASLAAKYSATLLECAIIVEAIFTSTWLKSMGRQELQSILSGLHVRLSSQILECITSGAQFDDALLFIRRSLVACLLVYGCDRDGLVTLDMVKEEEIKDLPSRKKLNTRTGPMGDPTIVDVDFIKAIGKYVRSNMEEVSCLVAKFLNTLVMDARNLEQYEVDNFVLRNGQVIASCAWEFYEVQRAEISAIRVSFLLRVLVVDTQPFHTLLEEIFGLKGDWQGRFLAIVRLFRIILDVTSPSFQVEDRQWRSSVIEIFYRFFGALWMDEKEEIRLAVHAWSQSLLPAHLEVISLCWNEYLAKAPITDRVRLVSFLVQLHPHFPTWKLLSWDAIIESLLEDDYLQKHGENDDGAAAAHLSMYGLATAEETANSSMDPETATLRVSIMLLSLQMIASGAVIDVFSILKIKFHLAQVLGFGNVNIVPASHGHAFHVRIEEFAYLPEQSIPCITHLPAVFDAPLSFEFSPAAMGGTYADDETPFILLVGSVFVDVLLYTFVDISDLATLPVLAVKSMLESLMIIIYKHDFDARPLRHLFGGLVKAVKTALDLVQQELSYEIRQLALSVVQAFIKRWPNLRGGFIVDAVEVVVKLIISLEHDGEDILVGQAKSFLENTFNAFSASGLFGLICKRTLDREFFLVIKNITSKSKTQSLDGLRDALLRDALQNAADNEPKVCEIMLGNVHTYIEVAHHEHYTAEMMQVVGNALTNIARRSSEWPVTFQPNSMLLIAATLLQHNKTYSRDLLSYVDTVLRVALTRFNVTVEALSRIMHVTATVFRKAGSTTQGHPNTVSPAVFEVIRDGLRKEGRITPTTVASTMEVLMASDTPGYISPAQMFPESFLSLAEDGFTFLQMHVWSEVQTENDFAASVAVAKAILRGAEQKADIMSRISDTSERNSRQTLSIRSWNMLAFAALSNHSAAWASILLAHFSTFSQVYNSSLRTFANPASNPPDTAQADINHAYNAIKLWILLALKKFRLQGVSFGREKDPAVLEDDEDAATRMIWNELWPAFALVVTFFESEIRVMETAALAALTWSTVADLFLFVRQSRSDVAREASSHVALLTRLHRLSAGDAATSNRLKRALRTMAEPPLDVPADTLITQIGKSMVAEEKILALEAKSREAAIGKMVPDRNRKDIRMTT